MNTKDIADFYAIQADAARAIGISPQLMSKIVREERETGKKIPIEYQIKWEVASKGALRADLPEELRTAV